MRDGSCRLKPKPCHHISTKIFLIFMGFSPLFNDQSIIWSCVNICMSAAKTFAFEVGQAKRVRCSFWGIHTMIHPKTTSQTGPVLDGVDCIGGRGFESGK